MRPGALLNRILRPFGFHLLRLPPPMVDPIYDQDGLRTHHNHEFMADPRFQRAYRRGIQAVGTDYHWHWRVHVGLWAADLASRLGGDFVECGVNRGFMASAVMESLDWDRCGRTFYLLDTFQGLDAKYVTDAERATGILEKSAAHISNGFYTTDLDGVRRNFASWRNIRIIPGSIPETLEAIDSTGIAFLHLDLNCTQPEVEAAEFLWDRLVPGALVLMDDYAYSGYRPQKVGMDAFARAKDLCILSLPTGQGLLIKPRHARVAAVPGADRSLVCSVCGNAGFAHINVLWDDLVESWQLAPEEAAYIDRQQGTHCTVCGANLRSIALANAIRAAVGTGLTLQAYVNQPASASLALLEINEAGTLNPVLRRLPSHRLAVYPAVDMHALPYPDAAFDLVVHSDTLEHVVDPVPALRECFRVLRPGGTLCYTVPTVVGRLTRSRADLPPSFHGDATTGREDFKVQREYGADAWTEVIRAGFAAVTIHAVDFPVALALSAQRQG